MWHKWSYAYQRFTFYPEAVERSRRALELLPEDPLLLARYGALLAVHAGNPDEGLRYIERGVAHATSDLERSECFSALASTLGALHRFEEADIAYEEHLKLQPDHAYRWNRRAAMWALWAHREWEAGDTTAAR